MLPAVATTGPEKYKSDLVEFKEERMPSIQKKIDALSKEYAQVYKSLSLPDLVRLNIVKRSLDSVNDRIFNVELYCGLLETVVQITSGEPAAMDEPIAIRQQLLFMDEESLFDYDAGGMDYERLEDFDNWVARPDNLARILPEKKGIVAFRVRRKDKDYGAPQDLIDLFRFLSKHMANRKTYLLIRNGDNVYRIATEIDFSPRLVPFRDEIGEKQFLKFSRCPSKREEEPELITPDNVRYDDHVEEMDALIKKYNRVFIILQGLLDRTTVFHPHPGIKLFKTADTGAWINCVRDEEDALPNETISWEGYRDQLNTTIKKGSLVWSKWHPDHYGEYYHSMKHYTSREMEVINRPKICEVVSVKRDRSEVRIRWSLKTDKWDGWNWVDVEKNRYLWVPMAKVFNVSGYTPGDYRMFLCDRALQGKYLKWAYPLLNAEKHHCSR
jgi:hypothetical protein